MRSIWKGSLAFGLVNVPVKVYSATEDHDVSFHQVHAEDGGRIRYQRRCEVCGEVVTYDQIAKAYDSPDGQRVILTDDDFATLPAQAKHEIEVLQFVPNEQIDPILLDRSYYLEPDSRSPKAYALLRRTLEETDRTAVVHFALRNKTRLAALRVRGDVLVVQTMIWPDEVRAAEFESLDEQPEISDKELAMSASLVESMAEDFDASAFTDTYTEQLRTLIDDKLTGGESFTAVEEEDEPADVVDLVAALRRSVAERKKAREAASGSTGDGGGAGEKEKAPAKKTSTAKKAPAKKAGSAKAPAKKPAKAS
ncbi:Ku protein [Litorihabitans aurantiacus]|uniref:Non-homologous end joining protein Ku n=1 Tax=Litorihabitans aurantiacus TaxID=1930061 RepID=A0AA37XGX9_9MICO|nr:Ku protein [Litorihabitans aurantiacus]GMA32525.1 non-homologous end joining protein Ku [Litorihabitans aurantiacus]